jgi:hypothetical protein
MENILYLVAFVIIVSSDFYQIDICFAEDNDDIPRVYVTIG